MLMKTQWYLKSAVEILRDLNSGEHGLSYDEAKNRFLKFGPNKFAEGKEESIFLVFIRQFQSPLIYILFAASLAVFLLGDAVDGGIILFVLLFNAIVGTVQEGRAQNTLRALKKFTETNATVFREGKEIIIPDTEVVPGDILYLREGEKVPADLRIISSNNLKIDESALTGESLPVDKTSEILSGSIPLADQRNMLWKGTHIVSGGGRAVAVATGLETVIGKIAKEVSAIDTEIPLKKNIKNLSRLIIYVVLAISVLMFALGLLYGKSLFEMFTTVVSLSVSVIPEGLPIVMTLVLSTGVWRMSKRNALVKKLQAVEALGQARVIAVDKTGTLTKNEMVIQRVYVGGKMFNIGGVGYEALGEISLDGKVVDFANHSDLLLSGKMASFCASARVMFSEEEKIWKVTGDPTEAAMLVLGEKLGFKKDDLESESPLIGEIPFDYKRKYHGTLHDDMGKKFMTIIGAPEAVLSLCSKIWQDGGRTNSKALTEKEKENLESVFLSMSGEGLRVLAFAFTEKPPESLNPENIESLTFVGFFGMKDALRPEVPEAMRRATEAGIKVVMITGDNKITGQAIAREAGIFKEGDMILTGKEIDEMSQEELSGMLSKVSVFARVTPEHKLRIIKAYRARGEVVAMTGDGVNDAPSLVAADLGVSMGKIGTEVAKEASDIVLLDDNFGSIVSAVEEGRNIYKTIKKVMLYLFSTSIGEVITIMAAILLGLPLPVLAAQIIWANFVTDGFLDVALAMEPKEEGLLKKHFERPKKYIVDRPMLFRIFSMAIPMAIGTLFIFNRYLSINPEKALTISFTTLVVFQWWNAWNARHESKSVFSMNPLSNKYLVGATFIVICLQLLAVYAPFLQNILRTVPLTANEWLIIVGISFGGVLTEEFRKIFSRKKHRTARMA